MIPQEKIKKKAEGYGIFGPMFLEGAEFALNNQWISVEEGLPIGCQSHNFQKNRR